ncbi:MAG TPA: beta galactosidase jelly roll domain-containing protein, partial [Candidatus Dormibacteraeota bacterium]|nr:beta galactosidase jelly roll domain-containing protein [Candidatus Dormibacteraeota bacterium]
MAAALAMGLLAALACSSPPPDQARLKPSLELRQVDGGQVAYELGQPVPTFDPQPRTRIDLSGVWRFQPAALDEALTFAERTDATKRALTDEAGARLQQSFDDTSWGQLAVPGTFSPPPSSRVEGGWYRDRFTVAESWDTEATLEFQSAGYVADAWLNGRYLGYHEGAWTAFALDATDALRPGQVNTLVVRVDDPPWGTRLDIVPWGLADWWNYGGITGPVSIEGTPALSLVRADVTPHLDGADVSVVLRNRGAAQDQLSLITEVLPTSVGDGNLTDPDPRHLVPAVATPVASQVTGLDAMAGGDVRRVAVQFVIRRADLWSPLRPALYVLRAALVGP